MSSKKLYLLEIVPTYGLFVCKHLNNLINHPEMKEISFGIMLKNKIFTFISDLLMLAAWKCLIFSNLHISFYFVNPSIGELSLLRTSCGLSILFSFQIFASVSSVIGISLSFAPWRFTFALHNHFNNYRLASIGWNFDDYTGFQPKTTPS